MADIRMLTNEEMKVAVRLSDATFRDAEQPSMGTAFPHIFADPMMHLSFGAFEGGKLVSFLGLVPWTIRIGEAKLRVFSLGSVCTDPEARGRGMASEVLQEIYRFIRKAGASLLLVSGNRTLYTRTGCAEFGRIARFGLDAETAERLLASPSASAYSVREMAPEDIYDLYDLASQRSVRYDFSVNELAALIKSEALASCLKMKHRVLIAENGGKPAGFAVIGVAIRSERRGLVLEQAGEPDAVVRLATQAVKSFGLAGLDFPVPWHETELHARLQGVPSSNEDHLGTIRVMDGAALVEQLRPWLDSSKPGAAAGLRLEEREDGSWMLDTGSQRLILTPRELVRLLFDRATDDDAAPIQAHAPEGLFPIPFPYPGGLAYI